MERSKDIDTQERKREYAEQSTKGTEKMLHAKTRQGSHWRSEAVNKGRRSFYPGVLDDGCPSLDRHICGGHYQVAARGAI